MSVRDGASLVSVHEGEAAGERSRIWTRWVAPAAGTRCRLGVLHGYGDHSGRYREFMGWMAERGVACHSFDFRGHGRSRGRRGFVRRWSEYLDDLDTFLALPALQRQDEAPLFLLGHSHGGLVLVAAAIEQRLPAHVRGVILTAPYFRNRVPVAGWQRALSAVANIVYPSLQVGSGIRVEWLSRDEAMCAERRGDTLALRSATPRWFQSMQRAQQRVMRDARQFPPPLLLLVAGADPIADPAAEEAFFAQVSSTDKTLRCYPEMVHEILRERGREEAYGEILRWIEQRRGISA